MNGKIIVIEGLDGTGKSTQFELLKEKLENFRFITFPNYQSPSGEIITQYLSGQFNESDESISAYSASSFYAVDRYTSFKNDWEKDYLSGVNIISARYTTSNAVYQTTKLPENMWEEYCNWLYDFEYKRLGIPRPDAVIFLDMPVEVSQKLLSARYNNDEQKKDIHESNIDYLKKCREAALYVSRCDKNESWTLIDCCKNGELRSIEDINSEIVSIINQIIKDGCV